MTDHDLLSQSLTQMLELSTSRSMHDFSQYVKTLGLSMPQIGLLMRLYHHGNCGVTDIGRHFGVTNPAASQLVDRLVEKHLIERTEDQNDRRIKQLSLTIKGRQLVEVSIKKRYLWVEELVASLSTEEKENLLKTLPLLVKSLQLMDETKGGFHMHQKVKPAGKK